MIDLNSNRIASAMSAEAFAATKSDIQKLTQSLATVLIKLDQEDTDGMYRMSDADKTFVRNCLTEMGGAGDILPTYVKPEDIQQDLLCGDQLLELENALSELLANVRRNRMLANHEAYQGASVFYRLVSAAARSGSALAKAMYERLHTYHQNRTKARTTATARTTAATDETQLN